MSSRIPLMPRASARAKRGGAVAGPGGLAARAACRKVPARRSRWPRPFDQFCFDVAELATKGSSIARAARCRDRTAESSSSRDPTRARPSNLTIRAECPRRRSISVECRAASDDARLHATRLARGSDRIGTVHRRLRLAALDHRIVARQHRLDARPGSGRAHRGRRGERLSPLAGCCRRAPRCRSTTVRPTLPSTHRADQQQR
jgi:hypothetical protein